MASVSMMASFVGGAVVTQRPSISNRQVVKAAAKTEGQEIVKAGREAEKRSSGRRAALVAVAAAAVSAVVGTRRALADEPKRGTPAARKLYAPICVTMPTARVCNKIA